MEATAPLNTLFRLTLASGVVAAVALHLRRGAPVNGRDANGRTPLILAATRGHAEVCRLLLDAGADINLQGSDGRNAFAAAQSRGHAPVVALLADTKIPKRCGEPDTDSPPSSDVTLTPEVTQAMSPDASLSEYVSDTAGRLENQDTKSDCHEAVGSLLRPIEVTLIAEPAGDNWGQAWLSDDEGCDDTLRFHDTPDFREDQAGIDLSALPARTYEAPPPAPLPPEQPFSDMPWEPEPQPLLDLSETGMEAVAAALQAGLTRHKAFTSDTDWTSIDVDLPEMSSIWAAGFSEDFDTRRSVLDLLATALHEGWLPIEQLEDLTAHAINHQHGTSIARTLRVVLDDMGVAVEDEHALEPSRMRLRTYIDEPASRKMEVDSAARLLADLPADSLDAETMLVEDASRASVLSVSEEALLFRELRQSLGSMLRIAATCPITGETLVRWADQLAAGNLASREVSTTVWGVNDAELLVDAETEAHWSIGTKPGEDEADASGAPNDNGEMLAIDALVSRLKETAHRITLRKDAVQNLVRLALTDRKVVELAENVLSVNGGASRRTARQFRISSRNGLSELHLLRGKPAVRPSSLPNHEIGVALDRYIAARRAIVEGNLRRVVWIARRYARAPVPFMDLVQEGQIGLLRAIELFDAARGTRFGSYATWWIRQSIHRAVQDTGRTIRVPVHMLERITKVRRKTELLRVKHGFEPVPAEVARALGLEVRSVEQMLAADNEVVPFDAMDDGSFEEKDASAPGGISIASWPADLATPLTAIHRADLRGLLLAALGKLDPRQAHILDLRFGLTTGEPMTLEEVGQVYGVTRERIRQIEAKALGRLPRLLPKHGFEIMLP